MAAIPKILMALGIVLVIVGIVMAVIPVTVKKDFSASEFSLIGNEYIAPSVNLPAGVVVTVSWETDSWQLFGTPVCALAKTDSSGNYQVLASGSGKSGSFTYTTLESADYYILQQGMTLFTSGTVSISYTYFPLFFVGIFMLVIGIIVAVCGVVLNRRAKKVTVIYTQASPMQQPPMQYQQQYPQQLQQPMSPPPIQPVMGPPPQQSSPPPAPMQGALTVPPQQPMAQPYQQPPPQYSPPPPMPQYPPQPPQQAPPQPYQPPPQQYSPPTPPPQQPPQYPPQP